MPDTPTVTLQPGRERRALAGYPWVYANEVVMEPHLRELPPGALVRLRAASGRPVGLAGFNRHSLIAARLLTPDLDTVIDAGFLAGRLGAALDLRQRLFARPFYRLVHAEADRLPGLVIDRYGEAVVVQANTAAMERLLPVLMEALDAVLGPALVVLRNDSGVRALEGLGQEVRVAKGEAAGPVELEENGARFLTDPVGGQKTGWFFDQRDNRAFVARLAAGRSLLDLYGHTGGFAVQAALAGAGPVVAVDRSQPALDLALAAARLNGVALETRRGDVFAEMERLAAEGRRFGVVVADPPAFVKSKKDAKAGAQGYRKLARLAARLVEPGGILFAASCSHHVDAASFAELVARGLVDAGRTGRVLRQAGAGPDHPVHPLLPESAYLKALTLQLD